MHSYEMDQPVLRFHALGKPVPQGSIRSFGKGRPSVHANQDVLLPWREHVQHCAQLAMQALSAEERARYPLDGPVALWAYFTLRKPTSAPKTRISYPQARPDTSHLVRAVEDAITAAGVWKDDSQVVDLRSCKLYPNEEERALTTPGVVIVVAPVVLLRK